MPRASFKNNIVALLSEPDFAALEPLLEPVALGLRDVIVRANAPIRHVYFPESGQLSVLARAPASEPIEVGMVGFEGLSDMVAGGRSSLETIVQVGGRAHRVGYDAFHRLLGESVALAGLLLRWHQAVIAQISYTALAHGSFSVSERLARFLLMMQDRLASDELPLVHEFLSWMLAVRRAGVSEALAELQRAGCIDRGRGRIAIVDRARLIEQASGSYGRAENEYDRLLGPMARPSG